jgi:hypothetical protein
MGVVAPPYILTSDFLITTQLQPDYWGFGNQYVDRGFFILPAIHRLYPDYYYLFPIVPIGSRQYGNGEG